MGVVYIDVVWLINFVMDGLILVAASWMSRGGYHYRRILFGSAVGASYSLLLLVPWATAPAISFLAKLLFSCFMVIISFRPQNVIQFFRFFGLFYLASFVLGGAAYGMNSIFHESRVLGGLVLISGDAVWKLNISSLLIIASIPTIYVIGKSAWNRMDRMKQRTGNLWKVTVSVDGHQATFVGLLDTGNALMDPITRLPVAVVEWEALVPILPEPIQRSYSENRDPTLVLGDIQLDSEWQARFRIIPYRGVGGSMGMLLAFRPADFVINQGNTQLSVDKILIAINPKLLSSERSYQAILPPSCLSDLESSKAS